MVRNLEGKNAYPTLLVQITLLFQTAQNKLYSFSSGKPGGVMHSSHVINCLFGTNTINSRTVTIQTYYWQINA